jgi:hypothetical protein
VLIVPLYLNSECLHRTIRITRQVLAGGFDRSNGAQPNSCRGQTNLAGGTACG